MAETLYSDTGYSLNHLIEDIRTGRIGLPDIQRPFVWSSAKARDLFDSMYRGYPVGTLMFWETGAEVGVRQIGTETAERAPQVLVVDGQQRLTSLYAVLTGEPVLTQTFENRRIRIGFRPEDETFEVTDAAIEHAPEFIPDITKLWAPGYKTIIREFMNRLAASRTEEMVDEHKDLLEERIDKVRNLRDFRFQIIELGESATEEQVAEIFVRINSEGVQLNQSDFILTLMSVHWEKGRRTLEAFSRAAVDPTVTGPSPRNPYLDPSPDQLLRVGVAVAFRRARLQHVYSILRGKDLDTGKVSAERRAHQFGLLERAQELVLDLNNWHEFLKCLRYAGFRNRKMITSDNALLFSYALWLIGRHDFGLGIDELRPAIGRWFFMSQTTGRYTNSPESQFEFDLGRIADLPAGDDAAYVSELDRVAKANFTNDYWMISLPNRLDTSSSRSPVLFAYLAALDLLDAEVLFSDVRVRDLLEPDSGAPRKLERGHLFPKKHLASQGISGTRQVNAIANRAFVQWTDSSKLNSAAPADYWPVLSSSVSPTRLKKQMRWHCLPIGWEQLDYATFLERRRSLIAGLVREAFDTLWGKLKPTDPPSVTELIASDESQQLEFKTTARRNMATGEVDPKKPHVIVKAVCGFLNAEGGTLLIGVGDSGDVVGIEGDMATLGKANEDAYELFLRQVLDSNLSSPTAATVRINFHRVQRHVVCGLTVAPSSQPVFANPPKGEGFAGSDFWVRVGNGTKKLHGESMVKYQKAHWG
ncbi:DUF262 domain-containing protein [Saccharopolyspora sp. NPDC000359]|uniref:GmrSD restriction endonuclease domain-containing protein n=1 Tax=Saccharopolyspora sp. NPDC000359 TaxID=3154251 RepID=UPI00332B93B7